MREIKKHGLKKHLLAISMFLMTGCMSFGRTGGCSCEKEYDCMMADQDKMSVWISECSKGGSHVKRLY